MKKRTWFILVFIFALTLLAAACGPVGDGPRLVSEAPALSGSTELAEVEVEVEAAVPAINDPFEAPASLATGEKIGRAHV